MTDAQNTPKRARRKAPLSAIASRYATLTQASISIATIAHGLKQPELEKEWSERAMLLSVKLGAMVDRLLKREGGDDG